MGVKIFIFTALVTISSNWLTVETVRLKYIEEAKLLNLMERDVKHECTRECVKGQNMICRYKFIVMSTTSMDINCKDCPYNLSHCSLPGCVTAGGVQRPVITTNRITPGPDIQVCEGDRVIVDVINALKTEGLTIHWHGLHQEETPFMDGTPYITQCPIQPFNKFRYEFQASPPGTHMWHSHVGFQDGDGLYGKLIVRRQEDKSFRDLYDYDLPEHSMIIWHWYNWTSQGILERVLHINGSIYGFGLLINGKGVLKEFPIKGQPGAFASTPRETFIVDKGKRYLFRSIANGAIYCPVQISVDKHKLKMISTSTSNFEPFTVDSFMMNAGERFNFIITADQEEDCYWIRFRAGGDCGEDKTSVHQEAFLCYKGKSPKSNNNNYKPTYDEGKRNGILFNAVEVAATNYENNTLVYLPELNSTESYKLDISNTPNVTVYVQLDAPIYDEADYPGAWPQFNNISFNNPTVPMYPQKEELSEEDTCTINSVSNGHCLGKFCSCPYIHELPLNALVEVVMVDISKGRKQDHPVHLHGNSFYVVALEAVGMNISFERIRQLNEEGKIKKVLQGVPSKDTVSVPNKGFTVIRFVAKNPGYWLFHCHVTNHMELGMAMVFKVGKHSEMIETPENFPRCGNWVYQQKIKKSSSNAVLRNQWFLSLIMLVLIFG